MTQVFCCSREQSYMESVVTFLQDVVPQVTSLWTVSHYVTTLLILDCGNVCVDGVVAFILEKWQNRVCMHSEKHLLLCIFWSTQVSHYTEDRAKLNIWFLVRKLPKDLTEYRNTLCLSLFVKCIWCMCLNPFFDTGDLRLRIWKAFVIKDARKSLCRSFCFIFLQQLKETVPSRITQILSQCPPFRWAF